MFNFKRNEEPVKVKVITLSPEVLEQIVPERTRLPWIVWYKAIYIVCNNPELNPNKLSGMLDVSHPTAKSMQALIRSRMVAISREQ
jgi:hypothetical protein